MLHHLRFIAPLLPRDEDKLSPLHFYDAAIQLARISDKELTEEEFLTGLRAAEEILSWYAWGAVNFLPPLCVTDLRF